MIHPRQRPKLLLTQEERNDLEEVRSGEGSPSRAERAGIETLKPREQLRLLWQQEKAKRAARRGGIDP